MQILTFPVGTLCTAFPTSLPLPCVPLLIKCCHLMMTQSFILGIVVSGCSSKNEKKPETRCSGLLMRLKSLSPINFYV